MDISCHAVTNHQETTKSGSTNTILLWYIIHEQLNKPYNQNKLILFQFSIHSIQSTRKKEWFRINQECFIKGEKVLLPLLSRTLHYVIDIKP